MNDVLHQLGVELPDAASAVRVGVRLVLATILGGCVGYERERLRKAAGLRTHMLVALGSALFVITSFEAGAPPGDMTRVVQGIATGIGFVGAGTILKVPRRNEVHGLTTAASVWLTAAIGVGVGLGRLWAPVAGVALAM